MKPFDTLKIWLKTTALTLASQFREVFHDVGAMIFFFILPLMYPIVYTLIYNPEVVENMPVAVVDQSGTAQSRELVRKIDATQALNVYTQCVDMAEAKDLFFDHKVSAIFVIPEDYERNIGRMEPANVSVYCDMSLLLRFRALLLAQANVQLDLIGDITAERADALGATSLASSKPLQVNENMMGDPTQGFASFVMPGIVILIMQQSMLLGITLLGGTRRERRGNNVPGPLTAVITGRALCCFMLYLPVCLYVTHFIPEFFSLPHYGNVVHSCLMLMPMLLATAFLGQAINYFIREREMCFMVVVFTSVILLFLSGLTWPRYAMPQVCRWLGDMLPCTWGVEGFIRMNSNSAILAETVRPYTAMWILTGVYFTAAWFTARYLRRHN